MTSVLNAAEYLSCVFYGDVTPAQDGTELLVLARYLEAKGSSGHEPRVYGLASRVRSAGGASDVAVRPLYRTQV